MTEAIDTVSKPDRIKGAVRVTHRRSLAESRNQAKAMDKEDNDKKYRVELGQAQDKSGFGFIDYWTCSNPETEAISSTKSFSTWFF